MANVAFIVDRTFDDHQFQTCFERIRQAGHDIVLVGPHAGESIHGSAGTLHVTVDVAVDDVKAHDFDAVVVPGGYRPNHLRTHERLLNFVRDAYAEGRPVGVMRPEGFAIVSAEAKRRGLVSWPSVKRDLLVEPHTHAAPSSFEAEGLIVSSDGDADAFCDTVLAQLDRRPDREDDRSFNARTSDDAVSSAYGPSPAPPSE